MTDFQAIYKQTPTGKIGMFSIDSEYEKGEIALRDAKYLESEGHIEILKVRTESMTGNRFPYFIQFKRLT